MPAASKLILPRRHSTPNLLYRTKKVRCRRGVSGWLSRAGNWASGSRKPRPSSMATLRGSTSLAALSLSVIYSDRYAAKQQHWAYATIGVLLGFWLKA